MQLSLPIPPYAAPDASSAAITSSLNTTDPIQKDAEKSTGDSFESLLKQDEPDDDSKVDDSASDAAKAAEMAAGLMWLPMLSTTLPPSLPSTSLALSTDETAAGEIETMEGSVCCATQSSRNFAFGATPTGPLEGRTFAAAPATAGKNALNRGDLTMKVGRASSLDSMDRPECSIPSCDVTEGAAVISNSISDQMKAVAMPAISAVAPTLLSDETGDAQALGGAPSLAQPVTQVKVEPSALEVSLAESFAGAVKNDDLKLLKKQGTGAIAARVAGGATSKGTVETAVAPNIDGGTPVSATLPEAGLENSSAKTAGGEKISIQEKNAAMQPAQERDTKERVSSEGKYFLDTGRKMVTMMGARVGTSVAKVGAIMSAAASPQPKSGSILDPAVPFVFHGETMATGTLTAEAPTPVSTVRETMAVILSSIDALERRADVQQKSVDLNLSVGNEKLGLRVELRDGSVHTTFRTESAEMNTVLAHEWKSIVHPVGERGLRLAEPVFHAAVQASGESSFSSLGQGAPQQREHKAPTPFVSALKREFYDSGIAESAVKDSPAVSSSQLLNALA